MNPPTLVPVRYFRKAVKDFLAHVRDVGPIVLTVRGTPVAKVSPIPPEVPDAPQAEE